MAAVSPPIFDPVSRLRNLSEVGSSVIVDNDVPPRRYLRSGLEMEKMANVYLEEGNLEHAFILYTKLITSLPEDSFTDETSCSRPVLRLLVEKLPKHVQYKQVSASSKVDTKKRVAQAFLKAEDLKTALKERYLEEFQAWQIHEAERKKMLEKEEEEKEKLREKEMAREKELERQHNLEKTRLKNEQNNHRVSTVSSAVIPSITPSTKAEEPTLPSYTQHTSSLVKDYPMVHKYTDQSIKTAEVERSTPIIDRATKPSWLDFVSGLRTIVVPVELMRKFIALASPNTRQNRETCGILAGKLSQNIFHMTHLIIPKQTSTSDSCTTLNEEDIFMYQDSHDLLTLGWIHTHPSQTAFMSSVDLHTHCSYQLMLPEALAIVCAPKHSQTGMYSLTNEYGLKFVAGCKQQGFHPHPKEPPIYEDCSHVKLTESSSIVVADLR